MSFISVVKKIFSIAEAGAAVVAPFAPAIEAVPGFGSVFGIVYEGILVAEQLVATPKSGASKKVVATSVVNALVPGLDQAGLANAIDIIVAALNQLHAATPNPA